MFLPDWKKLSDFSLNSLIGAGPKTKGKFRTEAVKLRFSCLRLRLPLSCSSFARNAQVQKELFAHSNETRFASWSRFPVRKSGRKVAQVCAAEQEREASFAIRAQCKANC